MQCETDPTQEDEVSDNFMFDIVSNYFLVSTVKKYFKGISHLETYLVINKSYWNSSIVSFYSVLKNLFVWCAISHVHVHGIIIINSQFNISVFVRTKAA